LAFLPTIMTEADPGLLSLVIPLLNERESLAPLFAEIVEVGRGLNLRLEVIFIDDGSDDGSWEVIRELAAVDERVRGIRLRKNFGKAAALQAGFQTARGGVVMTLDADLQDDPREIPRFLEQIRNGLDVVSGWKKIRHDPWHKVFPSRIFNILVGRLMGLYLHDHNCGMKAYRAEVLNEIALYGELHRFVPILAAARGFKVGELVINHRSRKFGRSKYRWQRFIKGFLDLGTIHFLTKFGHRPQHLLGSYGLAAGCSGLLGMVVSAFVLWAGMHWNENSVLLIGILGFVCGVAMILMAGYLLATGLLAELVTERKMMEQEPYSIADRTHSKRTYPDA
jgi:glycosyltransferase involved in cell wall biosynthesis